jgi:rhodanese-related sulfurtransferase
MSTPIKQITPHEAREQQAAGAAYLDVRSIPEFEQGHPEGAFNVPLLHVDAATGMMRPNQQFLDVVRANFPTDAPLVVGCKMGGRSQQACELLTQIGYTSVANVMGGFHGAPQMGQTGWLQEGLPVADEPQPDRDYESLQRKAARPR